MRYKLKYLFLFIATVTSVSSCGLINLDPEEVPEMADALTLNRDTIDVVVGEEFEFSPTLSPAHVGERTFVWSIDNADIVSINQPTITALQEGETKVRVTSLYDDLTDSCYIRVWRNWEQPDISEWRLYDTVVLANVSINGKPMTGGMILAAFLDDQLRCIAEQKSQHGISFMQMRVWNDRMHDPTEYDPDDEDAPPVDHHFITFKLYDTVKKRVYDFPEEIPFDGETHGALPDNLLQLSLKGLRYE